jgi:alpha-galactosidase
MNQIAVAKARGRLDAGGFPDRSAWMETQSVAFCSDWRAEHPDPMRQTTVRFLWSIDHLFVRFHCSYRELFVYEGSPSRRDQLWLRDVAEIFIQPETEELRQYREFEISPNGDWLDLEISPGSKRTLFCDLKSRVALDQEQSVWTAEMAIPMNCLTTAVDPAETWRLNLFRIEGRDPKRFYSAWIPTYTPHPNFHVPEAFGALKFLL